MNLRFANSTPEYDAEAAASNGTRPLSVTISNYAQAFGTWAAQGFEQVGIPVFPRALERKAERTILF